jgi:hypothetical protein
MPRRSATNELDPQDIDLDVDVPSEPVEDDETETVPATTDESNKPAKTAAAKKEPARGDLPEVSDKDGRGPVTEGDKYVTPVGLAHELSKPLDGNAENTDSSNWRYTASRGANAGSHTVAPQMVYSYKKNAGEKSKNPFPTIVVKDTLGNDREVVRLSQGLAWWDEKNGRAKERAVNAQAKAAKKAEKTEQGPQVVETEDAEPAVEAE